VCPSFFQTNLAESLRTEDPGLRTVMTKLLARSQLTADDVADETFRAVAAKQFYVLPHREARTAWRLKRLLPRELYRKAIGKQFRGIQRAAKKEEA
jgi:short-subunit dehydrogenase